MIGRAKEMASAMSAAKGVLCDRSCEDRGHEEQTADTLQTLGLRHPTSDFARIIFFFLDKGTESEGGESQSC